MLFTSAALNFGVNQLLDTLVRIAPPPSGQRDVDGVLRPVDSPFSAFVFKVQAGMDSAHRDRIAYARVCSGTFERGDVLTHAATGKPFVTKYAQSVFGQQRSTLDSAWPGDVIGLANAAALRPGDTLYRDVPVHFPPIPSFSPEHFAVARGTDPSKHKQFRKGIEQLDQEGVVQVLRSDRRGDQAPVFAAVGPMQFEVASHRMAGEFSSPIALEPLPYTVARAIHPEDAAGDGVGQRCCQGRLACHPWLVPQLHRAAAMMPPASERSRLDDAALISRPLDTLAKLLVLLVEIMKKLGMEDRDIVSPGHSAAFGEDGHIAQPAAVQGGAITVETPVR